MGKNLQQRLHNIRVGVEIVNIMWTPWCQLENISNERIMFSSVSRTTFLWSKAKTVAKTRTQKKILELNIPSGFCYPNHQAFFPKSKLQFVKVSLKLIQISLKVNWNWHHKNHNCLLKNYIKYNNGKGF